MALDDFRFNSAAMEEAIGSLTESKSVADQLSENIKNILRDKLTQEGIVGNTAEAIIAAFDEEVTKKTITFSEASEKYINQNTQVAQLQEENSKANIGIMGS